MLRRCAGFAATLLLMIGCSRTTQPGTATQGSGAAPQGNAPTVAAPSSSSSNPTAQQLIMQARQAGTQKQGDAPNFEGSIDKLERALELEPTNLMALGMVIELSHNQALSASKRGDNDKADPMYLKAASYLRRLRDGSEPLNEQQKDLAPVVFYNEARVLARQEHAEQSVGALKDAVAAGFKDFDAIDKNPDFDAIREKPEFQEWRKQVQ